MAREGEEVITVSAYEVSVTENGTLRSASTENRPVGDEVRTDSGNICTGSLVNSTDMGDALSVMAQFPLEHHIRNVEPSDSQESAARASSRSCCQ
jgi:hypothetical protein